MRIVCIGYGRLGTQLVKMLDTRQHDVMVIDKNRTALERRERDLHAKFFFGNAIDEHVLREAGVEHTDVFFALTREENTNLMAAQVARSIFNIPRVIAVVYDPAREGIYRAAGIETLPITVAGAEYLLARMEAKPDSDVSRQAAWERARGHAAAVPLPSVPARAPEPSQPFYVIVIGGARVGYYLTKALRENNIEVCIIENKPEIYDLVSQQVDCPVIFGNGSSSAVLEQAGAKRANVLVAATNHDEDNLIACQVAKQLFGIPKTIARVKNPRNEMVMQRLGVDITVSSTSIITGVIQSELPTSRIRTVLDLHTGGLELKEYCLDSESPVTGKALRELDIPNDCNIVTILRKGDAIIPRGDAVLENGDTVLALIKSSAETTVRDFLLGS